MQYVPQMLEQLRTLRYRAEQLRGKVAFARRQINQLIRRNNQQWIMECSDLANTYNAEDTNTAKIPSRLIMNYYYLRQLFAEFYCQASFYNKGDSG